MLWTGLPSLTLIRQDCLQRSSPEHQSKATQKDSRHRVRMQSDFTICLESYSLISIHGREKELMSGCEVGLFVDDIVLWQCGPVITAIKDNIDFALEEVWTFA
ncbi:hypothetical protein CEXT_747971 [Caerostris extrusa]|uniref:Uncharacterized protein n=1 Tax=Caerostris extrusa TaxID=172846 RepID=A0AAV4T705_CAEEX|nr:hypothetical protein CEXT_747971 [Caerostris extrusa]